MRVSALRHRPNVCNKIVTSVSNYWVLLSLLNIFTNTHIPIDPFDECQLFWIDDRRPIIGWTCTRGNFLEIVSHCDSDVALLFRLIASRSKCFGWLFLIVRGLSDALKHTETLAFFLKKIKKSKVAYLVILPRFFCLYFGDP